MIARNLIIGAAFAALVSPAAARDSSNTDRFTGAPGGDGVVITSDDGSEVGGPSQSQSRRRRVVRATRVAPLPPARPDNSVASAEPASVPVYGLASTEPTGTPSQSWPDQSATPSPVVIANAVLPPLRPGTAEPTPPAHADPAPVPAATAELPSHIDVGDKVDQLRAIRAIPPARPDFASDAVSTGDAGFAAVEVSASGAQIIEILPPSRPGFPSDEPIATASLAEPAPQPAPRSLFGALFGSLPTLPGLPSIVSTRPADGHNGIDGLIARHAQLNDVPEDLVHRVVIRESKYNPRAIGHGGALGLMQIKHATARALGYMGPPAGLLDAETNLTYAVKYLAGAYRTAAGNYDRAVAYYARGYYYATKSRDVVLASYRGRRGRVQEASALSDDKDGVAAARVATGPVERLTEYK